jgi:hypothetical protein
MLRSTCSIFEPLKRTGSCVSHAGVVHRLDQDALRFVVTLAVTRLQPDLPHDAGQTAAARLVGVFQDAVRVWDGERHAVPEQQEIQKCKLAFDVHESLSISNQLQGRSRQRHK